jgi:tol-pal system protein YbgF
MAPRFETMLRPPPVISLRTLRLTAVVLACLGLASAVRAQGFDLFHRQTTQSSQPAPPADVPGDAGGAPELVLRVNRLEEQLRQANGRIEELENAEHRLEDQLQKFRQDVEFRFGERSGHAEPPAAAPAGTAAAAAPQAVIEGSAAAKPKKSDAFDPEAVPNAPGAPQPLGTTAPSAPLVRPAQLPAGTPLELGKGAASAPPPPAATGPLITGSGVAMLDAPRDQFNTALQAFQTGEYQQAEEGFKAFMSANTGHRLTPDAIFYIGETYFQRSRPREAAEQYLKVTTDYSKSTRAPESMVRLGQTLAALGNAEQACATFTEFGKRYPAATASVKRLAEREMAKDHC